MERLWVGVADAYARSFAGLCALAAPDLLDGVPPGARVLDVGCGSGGPAATLVAAGREVVACDPDPAMVARARAAVPGLPVVVAGLPALPWPDRSADAVVAGFVVNHVDDPRAAVAELARVTRGGGRVLATVWPGDPPPQAVLWSAVLDAAGAERPALPRLPAGLDFERSPEGLVALMAGAGLRATGRRRTGRWRVHPEDFWVGATHVGNFGVTWRAQPPAVRDRVREAYDELREPWLDGEELVFDVEWVLAEGERPTAPAAP